MALHGEIKVNGHIIGDWSAVRIDQPMVRGEYEYECEVARISPPESLTFKVWHLYDDGAMVLASKILSIAANEMGMQGG